MRGSASNDATYIEIPNWEKFQHYGNRRPIWIKNYVDLMSRDEYLQLSGHRRAILHGLWMEYASSSRRIPGDTLTLTRRLFLRVSTADLEALNHAGFIRFSASKSLAPKRKSASAEVEVEVEKYIAATPLSASENGTEPAPKKARKPRQPDALWDACTEVWGQPANDAERGRRAKAVKLLRQAFTAEGIPFDAALEEIRKRVTRYSERFDHLALPSDVALASRWSDSKPTGHNLLPQRR